MSFTEKMVVAKISAKAMNYSKFMKVNLLKKNFLLQVALSNFRLTPCIPLTTCPLNDCAKLQIIGLEVK